MRVHPAQRLQPAGADSLFVDAMQLEVRIATLDVPLLDAIRADVRLLAVMDQVDAMAAVTPWVGADA